MKRTRTPEFVEYWTKSKNILVPLSVIFMALALIILPKQANELVAYFLGDEATIVVNNIEHKSGDLTPYGFGSRFPTTKIYFSYNDEAFVKHTSISIDSSDYKLIEPGKKIKLIKYKDVFVSPNLFENLLGVIVCLVIIFFTSSQLFYNFFLYKKLKKQLDSKNYDRRI